MNSPKYLLLISTLFLLACEKTEWQKVRFESADGLEVTADLYDANDLSAPMIVMFHQSASSRGEYRKIAPVLRQMGFNCLAVDLRWGKQDFWEKISNETAAQSGAVELIDNYEDNAEYREKKVWPLMQASLQDMDAAVAWVRAKGYNGKMISWGSSFSAMLQFKQAANSDQAIDGIISFSPGEYHETDTTMLASWAVNTTQPTMVVAGSDTSEYQMTLPVFELLANPKSQHYWVKNGRHGSSILLADSSNWEPVWQFLHQFKNYKAEDYLGFAKEVEAWLNAQNQIKDGYQVSPDAIDEPEKVSTSYSDGMAGKLTFYLDMHAATGEAYYLQKAESIGDYLLVNLAQKSDSLKGKFWAFSAYGGVCGPGYALTELYKATGKEDYKTGVSEVLSVLEHFADNKQDTLSWDLGNDVLGGLSGTGLFLLYAHRELNMPEALDMATRAGNTLLSRAISEGEGWAWKRGQDSRFILPNFSHGPAGIGYFLLSLYEATDDEKFFHAAQEAIRYLDSIAKTDNDTYLIPYGFPDPGWRRAYDIGWAHGPAGVARLFIKMYQVTGEDNWLERAEACYRGILSARPFEAPKAEFGAQAFGIDQRFGLAGVASFAQDLYRLTGKPEYLEFSKSIAADILSKASWRDGLSWPIPRFNFMANRGQITTFTGFFYGSTGHATVLLEQYNIMKGKDKATRFVDDPFGGG